jgi:hypothetical protein
MEYLWIVSIIIAFIVIIVIQSYFTENYVDPTNTLNTSNVSDQFVIQEIHRINQIDPTMRTIFISVASYRDTECPNTINSIFKQATHPERIFVGICQQNNNADPDCFDPKYKDNIRITRLTDKDAKGPTYARYLCSKLYNGEDYYMQIDSHTRFIKDYDDILIDMFPSTNEKIVITTYPNDWITENKGNDVSVLCNPKYEGDILSFGGLLISPPDHLFESGFVTGGFFITYGAFLQEVPYDGNLPFLFTGEEILFTVRLWTNGWNFLCPNRRICYHFYTRSDHPKYWENPDYKIYQPKSFEKVRYLLKLTDKKPTEIITSPYGLGTKRSLNDYYNYIGFNPKTKTFSEKKFCKGIDK